MSQKSWFFTKILSVTSILLAANNPLIANDNTTHHSPLNAGIDVSHYQGTIRWDQVKKEGISFAFAKATGGTGFTDPQFLNNWHGMKEAQIIRGAYHFFYPNENATAQANHFLSVVGPLIKPGDLPPTLGLEITDGVTGEQLIQDITTWLTTVEQALGCKPIINVNKSFAEQYLGDHFTNYPLWLAEYTTNPTPTLPTGWKTWQFWQYSPIGTISGITGAVDSDRFNGSHSTLQTFIKNNPCHSPFLMSHSPLKNIHHSPLIGIDVSHYQGTIRWDQVKKEGISFAFAKATGGAGFTDPQFLNNWHGMKEAQIIRGAYHFFYPNENATAQANHFLSVVGPLIKPGDLPPMLDLEITDGVTGEQLIRDITTWLTTVEKALGYKPIIYADKSFADQYLGDHFADYPLWLAEYTTNPTPNLPTGWKTWQFWQYSQNGKVSGIAGAVDMDRFNGSYSLMAH